MSNNSQANIGYNWNEILKQFNDKELYKVLVDKETSKKKKSIAEKILFEKGLIVKNDNDEYIKEEIENKYYNLVTHYLRNKSKEETIEELIIKGLNKQSAIRLVNFYQDWKKKQKKKVLPWKIILPFLFILFFYIIFKYGYIVSSLLVFIPIIYISINEPTFINFKKQTIFKVIKEEE